MKDLFIWLLTRTRWGEGVVLSGDDSLFVPLFLLFLLVLWCLPAALLWWLGGGTLAVGYVLGTVAVGALLWLARH